ncbi:hypothetical protein [Shewanella psychrotolerans]|uniref:hypothetical protein n=1 Tax=Shewanella psychrotolerans TaxID=2864206 RepID=UPI001C65A77A|nr:hypothetical protein [Shewanella psychrotolerans]QYK02330.1 hypothetical protein K0I62_05045 [Shewanella psychrotolerans]
MSCHSQQFAKPTHSSIVTPLTKLMPLLCAALLISNVAHAGQQPTIQSGGAAISSALCHETVNANQYQASYEITSTDKHSLEQKSLELTVTRFNDNIIYKHNDISFEAWNKNGEYVRYFPKEKRSISYRRGDLLSLNISPDLDRQFHLISQHGLSQLTKINSDDLSANKDQCYNQQHYSNNDTSHPVTVTWLPEMSLPKSFTVNNGQQTIRYQLTELKAVSHDAFKQLITGYQDLDFADVGDSESDPFIAKMITQGFIQHGGSGFYSSDGQMIDAGHGGHQH